MTDHDDPDVERRLIELEIEVPGTPEEVWRAIATGPGISSWYVPHTVEEREDGRAVASFGPEPEMQAPGRVAAWDPPRRLVIDGGEGVEGLAFEWLVEAKNDGTCLVRLVNSGFLVGDEWDDYYDGMTEGWGIFLANLRLHLRHFSGRSATPSLPLGSWSGPRDETWLRLTGLLGIPSQPEVGDRLTVDTDGVPRLAGEVVDATPHRISILVDDPAAGTAFIAAEGRGDQVEVSVWTYLYGADGTAATTRDEPVWRAWLASHSVTA